MDLFLRIGEYDKFHRDEFSQICEKFREIYAKKIVKSESLLLAAELFQETAPVVNKYINK